MTKLITVTIGFALSLIPQLAAAQAALVMVTYVSEGDRTVSSKPAQSIIHNYIDITGCQTAARRASLEATIPENQKTPSIVMSFVCIPTEKAR